jgi:hypothetical protein
MWWHTVTHRRGSEAETGEWSTYPVLFTLPRNMVYPALLLLMRTPRRPVEHVWNVMAQAQIPDLVFQRNGRVHLNWRGEESAQSTAGSRVVRISDSNGSNAGYTLFWGSVQDHWLLTPLACSPFISSTVRHRVPSGLNWAIVDWTDSPVDLNGLFRFVERRNRVSARVPSHFEHSLPTALQIPFLQTRMCAV